MLDALRAIVLFVLGTVAACDRVQAPKAAAGAVSTGATSKAPDTRDEFGALVPDGWEIENVSRGLLNDDAEPDAALTLGKAATSSADSAQEPRVLLVALGTPTGGFRVAERVDDLLPCRSCLGWLGAADGADPVITSIGDGRLTIGWLEGSRESKEVNLELVWKEPSGPLVLARDLVVITDRATGSEQTRSRDFMKGVELVDGTSRPFASDPMPAAKVRYRDY